MESQQIESLLKPEKNVNCIVETLYFIVDAHDAKLRRHLETTEITIRDLKKSQYERIFRETIRQLEALVTELNC